MRSDNMALYRDLTLYNFVYIEFQLDYQINTPRYLLGTADR